MNKRFSVIIALCFVLTLSLFAGSADEKKLLALVPAAADGVISVDIAAWSALPAVKKGLTESPEVALLKKRTGLAVEDISSLICWGQDSTWSVLVSTKKPFDPAKFFTAPNYTCTKSTVSGRTLYTVTSALQSRSGKKRKRARSNSFCVTVLSKNVSAFFSNAADAQVSLAAMKGKTGFAFPANLKGSVKGIFNGGNEINKAVLSGMMTGPAKDTFSGMLSITVPSEELAEQMRGQVMLLFNMFLLQGMKDAPELASDLMKQCRFDVKKSDVIISVQLPTALLDRLGQYFSRKSSSRKAVKKTPRQPGK